jgi:uncharacterized membrane protein (DUF4010 family)
VVSLLNLEVGRHLWMPLAAYASAGAVFSLFLFWRDRSPDATARTPFSNPFELGPALRFGLLFILILIASRAAQFFFGNAGIYISSFAAGLMDVDAVSFSMTRLNGATTPLGGAAPLAAASAGKAVLLAVLSNSLLKGGFAMAAGSRELRLALLPGAVAMLAAGCAAAWLTMG